MKLFATGRSPSRMAIVGLADGASLFCGSAHEPGEVGGPHVRPRRVHHPSSGRPKITTATMSDPPPKRPKPKPRRKPKPKPRLAQADPRVAAEVEAPADIPISAPADVPAKTPEKASAKAAPKKAVLLQPGQTSVPAGAGAPTASDRTRESQSDFPAGDEEAEPEGGGSFLWFTALPSWLTSTILHLVVLLTFALFTLPSVTRPDREHELVLAEKSEVFDDLDEFSTEVLDSVEIDSLETADPIAENLDAVIVEEPAITSAMDLSQAALKVDLDPLGLTSVTSSELGKVVGISGGEAFSGRGAASRARMVREAGGTAASEAAVASALGWLERHQMPDGGWSLDHKKCAGCQGRCPDIGTKLNSRNGATALALLPFLGSGQTHKEGRYQDVVKRGLDFLRRNIRLQGNRGSLVDPEGNYYSHGLATIVMSEAYAMTRDKTLGPAAQALINEIVFAQDPIGGGWRYKPRSPGDTSVVGFQLMALKSANMAYLDIPSSTIEGVDRFLNSVQSKNGANYGYTDPSANWRNSTAAVGLLCRMYMGWGKDHPGIVQGVEQLSTKGPDDTDIYYNYYATQVMRHYGGERWKNWNATMRDQLVNSQDRVEGAHRDGSWFFRNEEGRAVGHANRAGGRLYCTAMATMILEVYYRHLPIYQEAASEDDFPL